MIIDFDPAKNARNIRERGLSFERAVEFDFKTAHSHRLPARLWRNPLSRPGISRHNRLHGLVFIEIVGGIRVISFRKANKREVKHYEAQSRIN